VLVGKTSAIMVLKNEIRCGHYSRVATVKCPLFN